MKTEQCKRAVFSLKKRIEMKMEQCKREVFSLTKTDGNENGAV